MDKIKEVIMEIDKIEDIDIKINLINDIKKKLHEISPFKNEPVDCVIWVKNEEVVANDYNPNKVAPPEMELLEISIINDGYTQPIVSWENKEKNKIEVIDGFHRNRVGKESKLVKKRTLGYLPITNIRKEQSDKNDRIASTIRHNRARGKHQIDAMSEIVIELKNRNWTNKRISKQLGMDEEEVLRLCQISGMENLFSDNDFNKAWESSDTVSIFEPLTDDIDPKVMDRYTIPNENDLNRIFHTYDKWECAKNGFYKSKHEMLSKEEAERIYADFFKDIGLFEKTLNKIITEWKYSCEHYLTNKSMNRIAWLGQASVCYEKKLPSIYSSGWNLLSEEEKQSANNLALKYLNIWLINNNRLEIDLDEAMSIGRQVELY
jgi:ParB-like chromosome segregation protein Spo0J